MNPPQSRVVRVERGLTLGTCARLTAAHLNLKAAAFSGEWSSWGGSAPLWVVVLGAPMSGPGSPFFRPSLCSGMLV